MTHAFVDRVLAFFEAGDWLVLQNEINALDYIIRTAHQKGMKIALNPSPFDSNLDACDLSCISLFMINEIEGGQITGSHYREVLEAYVRKHIEAIRSQDMTAVIRERIRKNCGA